MAILLTELVCFLPLRRPEMVRVTVIACFSIGLGAALTPLGEPLSTITVEKLAGFPYYAGFWYLFSTIGSHRGSRRSHPGNGPGSGSLSGLRRG